MKHFNEQFKARLLTPGPTAIPDSVREAMAQAMIHHRKGKFKEILAETQSLLKELFATTQPVMPIACSGTGAMVAAVTNLFNPDEEIICIEAGKFGERFVEIAQTYGIKAHVLKVQWSKAVEAEQVEEYIKKYPKATAVLMQACETSTAVMQDVEAVAKITAKYNKLLVVDGISQVGIAPCYMDKWGIDCLLTGSQKGLLCPPGLAFIALSEKAWAKAQEVKAKDFYFNLEAERKNCLKNQTNFTTPVSLITGLHQGLIMLSSSGLNNIYSKQFALRQMTRTGLRALNLKLFVEDSWAAYGLTSVLMPENKKSGEVLKAIEQNFNLVMASGQDDYQDKIIRIGHMGYVDYADVLVALNAIAKTLAINTSQNSYLSLAADTYFNSIN